VKGMIGLFRISTVVCGLAILAGAPAFGATECKLSSKFNDPHPVLHDATKSLFWVRPLQVDADGAPNAYHRDDPHGTKGLAIEYIGNGMTIARNGVELPFNVVEEENADWLAAYGAIVSNKWQATPDLSADIYGFARNAKGEVCVGPKGRLISATSLVLRTKAALCDQRRYVNATTFPGIVVPNRSKDEKPVTNADPEVAPPFARLGAARGDLAIVYYPETGRWSGALLYDTGPRHLLGEGSIRLAMNLTGRESVPKSAVETNSMGLVETYTILFPGTFSSLGDRRKLTPRDVEKAATKKFRQWGDGSVAAALRRLVACAEEYKKQSLP
jgi:hypothetical protein